MFNMRARMGIYKTEAEAMNCARFLYASQPDLAEAAMAGWRQAL